MKNNIETERGNTKINFIGNGSCTPKAFTHSEALAWAKKVSEKNNIGFTYQLINL